jgi:hypothetical protein
MSQESKRHLIKLVPSKVTVTLANVLPRWTFNVGILHAALSALRCGTHSGLPDSRHFTPDLSSRRIHEIQVLTNVDSAVVSPKVCLIAVKN